MRSSKAVSSIRSRLIAGVAGSVGAALLLAACSTGSADHDMASMGDASSGAMPSAMASAMASMGTDDAAVTQTGDSGDIMFAQMMIPHHEQAVEMADMALANPDTSPFVRDLAARIQAAQQPEIDQMTGWLTTWGVADMGDMDMGHGGMPGMMSAEQMNELSAAQGADFNRLWLAMMIEHHQGAIEMADEVLKTTSSTEVAALARAITQAQQGEIEQMQAELDR